MDSVQNTPEIDPKTETALAKTEIEFQFPDTPTLRFCSANVCLNGHEWKPEVQLVGCPGCATPLLAVKMVQCPICNEPVAKMRLRSDHLPKVGSITPLCKGSATLAEVTIIELERTGYLKEQETHQVREIVSKV